MTLSDVVQEQLKLATVTISQPWWVEGDWEAGEMALVFVTITNSTGMTLRDVTIDLVPTHFAGYVSGAWTTPELEPDSIWHTSFAVTPANPSYFVLAALLSAEIVPYSSIWSEFQLYSISP